MRQAEGILDCADCEFSTAGGDMCPVVALNSLERLRKTRFEQDERPALTIATIRENANEPAIREVTAEECEQKKLRHASMRSGFGMLVD